MGTLSPKCGRSIFAATKLIVGERHLDHSGDGTIETPPFPPIVPTDRKYSAGSWGYADKSGVLTKRISHEKAWG